MLAKERAEQILTLHAAGWSGRAIAKHLGHSHNTVIDYLNGRRIPGVRADSASALFTNLFADYCRQRLIEDPHLRRSALFEEATDLGSQGSRSTFYRGLARHLPSSPQHPSAQDARQKLLSLAQRPAISSPQQAPRLPRPIAPITGEELRSYLARLAHANHLTLTDLLAALPIWFSTKINNRDDRAQHHMLAPATTEALHALARLTGHRSLPRAPGLRHQRQQPRKSHHRLPPMRSPPRHPRADPHPSPSPPESLHPPQNLAQ